MFHEDCLPNFIHRQVADDDDYARSLNCPATGCKVVLDEENLQCMKNGPENNDIEIKLINELPKCGTKVSAMLVRLRSIMAASQEIVKVLIFCQYRGLSRIIYSAIKDFGTIGIGYVHGSAKFRAYAISHFKRKNDHAALILSTEDSVSGLHLPEATHIFFMHPFYYGDEPLEVERAISKEAQAIARAHRIGLYSLSLTLENTR